jgi:hypothetical protein
MFTVNKKRKYLSNKHRVRIWFVFISVFAAYYLFKGFSVNKLFFVGLVFMVFFFVKMIIISKHFAENEK